MRANDEDGEHADTWEGPYKTKQAAERLKCSEQSIRDYANNKRKPPPGVEVKKERDGWYNVKTRSRTASPNKPQHPSI